MEYPFSDALLSACEYAATIARNRFQYPVRMIPEAFSETATVTFIEIKNKTYAVTARHVIESFRKLAKQEGCEHEGYFCCQSPGVCIPGPFLTPPADYLYRPPDIAICPISTELPGYIGKKTFQIRAKDDAKWPVSHALAIGFPTAQKHDRKDQYGNIQMALPCVQAVAKALNSDGSSDQVQFYSEITKRPEIGSLSGMSGGPVFWSDGNNHGLLGFVKEAMDDTSKKDKEVLSREPKVNFICQRVDYKILFRWSNYIDKNWQAARNKINAAIRDVKGSGESDLGSAPYSPGHFD